MTHRALIVAAVSTTAQAADDKASIPRQLEDCRAACAQHAWEVVAEIVIPGHSRNYDDLAELVADCPEYGQIIKHIANGEITLLVAWAYDRLWRTDALRAQVMAHCRKRRVQVYCLNQPMEPNEDGAANFGVRVVETIGGLISESENETRVRRMVAGKQGVIKGGGVQYNDRPPYGYLKDGKQALTINPATAPNVRLIYDLRVDQRLGFHAIARELNRRGIPSPLVSRWGHSIVARLIRNTIYKGETHWGAARCIEGNHEAIVTPEVWERAQYISTVARNLAPYDRPLVGLCRCGFCGYAMAYDRPHPPDRLQKGLRCGHYLSYGGACCTPNWNNAQKVEDFVFDKVRQILIDRDAFIESRHSDDALDIIQKRLNEIDSELDDIATRKRRAYAVYEDGTIEQDEYSLRRRALEHRGVALELERNHLLAQDNAIMGLANNLEEFAVFIDELAQWSAEELHAVYIKLIKRVVVTRGQSPVIEWL